MVKKHNLWYKLKYYSIVQYVIFAVILYLISHHIRDICQYLQIPINNNTFELIESLLPFVFIFLWAKLFSDHIRSRRYFYYTGRRYKHDLSTYNRGYYELVEYFEDADPYKYDVEQLKKVSWKQAEGMILGRTKDGRLFNIESGRDGQNYFMYGLPSYGKTTGPIICSCLRFGMHHPLSKKDKSSDGSVFCIDLKGDIYNVTSQYRSIKSFNLMDPKHSAHFNPLAGIEKLSIDDRCNYVENLGFNIIPAATGGESRYFVDTAYDFFNGIALYLLDQDINTSFPDIIKAILSGNSVEWVKRVCASDCEEAKNRLKSKYGENEKNLSGGYSLCATYCRKFASKKLFFLLGNDPKYDYISTQTLEDGYDVYIQLDQQELVNYTALLSMIVQCFLTGFLTRERNKNAGRLEDGTLRPVLMCLDEFAQLDALKYEVVKAAFMTLRSKNISICCAMQSRSSINEMFHSPSACQSLTDCVQTFCFLSIQEVETREWASKLIGNKKVLRVSNSVNSGTNGNQTAGRSVQEAIEPIFQPADFGNLLDKKAGKDEIIIYSKGKYIKCDKQYFYK